MRVRNDDPMEALMRYVTVDPRTGCWNRSGATNMGYPVLKVRGKMFQASRLSYELHTGVAPGKLTIDHLCRNRHCVNPAHMQLVTRSNNTSRAKYDNRPTHCAQGHPFSEYSVYYSAGPSRPAKLHCKLCQRARSSAYAKNNREKVNARKRAAYARKKHLHQCPG